MKTFLKFTFVTGALACAGISSAADLSALKNATTVLQGCTVSLTAVNAIKPGMIPAGYTRWMRTKNDARVPAPRNLQALQRFSMTVEAAKRSLSDCATSAQGATAKANAALALAAKEQATARTKADSDVVKFYHDTRVKFVQQLTAAVQDRRIQSLMSDALRPLLKV